LKKYTQHFVRRFTALMFFTLIELLITISIIVILAALLLPGLSRAKERGRQIVCASNLRQVGNNCNMYIGDFNGWMPGGCNTGGTPSPTWYHSLSDYMPTTMSAYPSTTHGNKLLNCPTNKYSSFTDYGPPVATWSTYRMCAGGVIGTTPPPAFCRILEIRSPSTIPYWLEIDNSGHSYRVSPSASVPSVNFRWNLYTDVHKSQSNVLFADGHVKGINSTFWEQTGPYGSPWPYFFSIEYEKPAW